MKYWEDMLTKWGFGDGNSTPDGIEVYRDVYLKVVNELARRNGSRCRYVPFDRPGVHNFCMVVLVTKQWFEEDYLPEQEGQNIWQSVDNGNTLDQIALSNSESDLPMNEAVSKASELYLDLYLDVTVTIAPEFEDFLTGPMLTEDEELPGEDWEEELEEQKQN